MKWLKRILFTLLILILTGVVLLVIFISPVVEWTIEKYSPEYIGRQVQMDDLTINLLIGRLSIDNLKVSEANGSADTWLNCHEISGAINVPKLFVAKYELQYVIVDGLETVVLQNGNSFNFDDLLALPAKYASKKAEEPKAESDPVDWQIKNIFLTNSKLRYSSKDYDIDYTASNLNIHSPLISASTPAMDFVYGFDISSGGHLDGAYSVNTDNLQYGLHFISQALNLEGAYPYVRDFIAVNKVSGMLDSDLFIYGNHRNSAYFSTEGNIDLSGIEVVDSLNQSIAAIKRLQIEMDSIEAHSNFYDFGDITLTGPYIKFELYKDGDNWTRLMKIAQEEGVVSTEQASYSNPFVIIANYLREYIKEYVVSNYYADHISLKEGSVHFSDYTLHDKFTANMDGMTMDIDRLNTSNDRLRMSFASMLNESADFDLNVAINPRDYQDMEMDFSLDKFNMSNINPYMVYYVAAPFTEGVLHFENKTTIASGIINVNNQIEIEQPRIGKKVKNSTAMNNLPVKLAVSMLKDPQGNIVLDIPVEGDLKDPEYKLGKTIWAILKNLLIKAAQAPAKAFTNLVGDKEEKLNNVVISYGLSELMPDQLRSLKQMAEPLKVNDEMNIIYTQWIDVQEEINTMITLEAREKYAEEKGMISDKTKKDDVMLYKQLLGISVNDSLFNQWLDGKISKNGIVESPVEKCKRVVNEQEIVSKQKEYMRLRENLLIETLTKEGLDKKRISIAPIGDRKFPQGDVPRFTYEVKVSEE